MNFNKMGSGLKYIKEIVSQGRNKDKPWNLKNQQNKLNNTKNPHNIKSRHDNK
jgi:hypothetical protein